MLIRRALYYWQFAAAIVLPTWILVARGILGSSVGWTLAVFILLCPMLALAMFAIAGVTTARKSVRTQRAVSWVDAAVIVGWHAAIITYGFVDVSGVAVLVVLVAVAGFWIAVYLLFRETRTRVRQVMAGFEQASNTPASTNKNPQDGRVIILEPSETREKP